MNKPMNPDAIFNYCCSKLGVSKDDITSRKRMKDLVAKRKIILLLLFHLCENLKSKEVTPFIGRHRTTFYHYIKTFNKMDLEHISKYNNLKEEISNLKVMEMQ
jgi:chromosomal replication initiation ATPase DnaA|tara:strand:+ start:365 stop:673 length:309 start_codon:yes stop_codon:yes gene_type:complete